MRSSVHHAVEAILRIMASPFLLAARPRRLSQDEFAPFGRRIEGKRKGHTHTYIHKNENMASCIDIFIEYC